MYRGLHPQLLARKIMLITSLIEAINPLEIDELLLWATAMEISAQTLRQRAAELAREQTSL